MGDSQKVFYIQKMNRLVHRITEWRRDRKGSRLRERRAALVVQEGFL
jgi:hypothetical protein